MQKEKAEITKSVNRVHMDDAMIEKLISMERIAKLVEVFQALCKEAGEIIKKAKAGHDWIKIQNRALYYVPQEELLIPDLDVWRLPCNSFDPKMDGFVGEVMLATAAVRLFGEFKDKNPLLKGDGIPYVDTGYCNRTVYYLYISNGKYSSYYIPNNYFRKDGVTNSDLAKIPVYPINKKSLDPVLLREGIYGNPKR